MINARPRYWLTTTTTVTTTMTTTKMWMPSHIINFLHFASVLLFFFYSFFNKKKRFFFVHWSFYLSLFCFVFSFHYQQKWIIWLLFNHSLRVHTKTFCFKFSLIHSIKSLTEKVKHNNLLVWQVKLDEIRFFYMYLNNSKDRILCGSESYLYYGIANALPEIWILFYIIIPEVIVENRI